MGFAVVIVSVAGAAVVFARAIGIGRTGQVLLVSAVTLVLSYLLGAFLYDCANADCGGADTVASVGLAVGVLGFVGGLGAALVGRARRRTDGA